MKRSDFASTPLGEVSTPLGEVSTRQRIGGHGERESGQEKEEASLGHHILCGGRLLEYFFVEGLPRTNRNVCSANSYMLVALAMIPLLSCCSRGNLTFLSQPGTRTLYPHASCTSALRTAACSRATPRSLHPQAARPSCTPGLSCLFSRIHHDRPLPFCAALARSRPSTPARFRCHRP